MGRKEGRKEGRKIVERNKRNGWKRLLGSVASINLIRERARACVRVCVWKRSTAICGRVSTYHPPFLRCLIDRFNYAGAACIKRKSKVRIARGMMVHFGCFVQFFSPVWYNVQTSFREIFRRLQHFSDSTVPLLNTSCHLVILHNSSSLSLSVK